MDSRGYPADEKSWMDAPTRLPGWIWGKGKFPYRKQMLK
jgi:hypothetical protein